VIFDSSELDLASRAEGEEDVDQKYVFSSFDNALKSPNTHRLGRGPKKRCIHPQSETEVERIQKYKHCKGLGHNKRTCKSPYKLEDQLKLQHAVDSLNSRRK
jgi:hypothetical protein